MALVSLNAEFDRDRAEFIRTPKYGESFCKNITAAWNSGFLCDVQLIATVDNTSVPAHKIVLASSSDYFVAMFKTPMRESLENVVNIGDMKGETLSALINFCYTGGILICENNVDTILKAASLLQLNKVVNICSDFIGERMQPSNCLSIFCIAECLNTLDLMQKAECFIKRHFLKVSQHQEFLELDIEHLQHFVKSEDITVDSEEDVFNILINWLTFKKDEREEHKSDLLSFLRLSQLKPSFILEKIEPICVTLESKQMVLEALKWHHLPKIRPSLSCTPPRITLLRSVVIIGSTESYLSIISYCPTAGEWTLWQPQICFRSYYAYTVLKDKLIILGGYKRKSPNDSNVYQTKSVQFLNMETMTVGNLPPMYETRFGLGAAVVGSCLYAIGGKNENEYFNSVECFNPNSGSWDFVAPMYNKRSFFASAVINDKIYVLGGYDSFKNIVYSTECYDSIFNKWSVCARMNMSCSNISVTVAKGSLYAIGSCIGFKTHMERYNPETDRWTTMFSLVDGPFFVGLTSVNIDLWAVTSPSATEMNALSKYDNDDNNWTEVKKLPMEMSSVLVVSIPNMHLVKLAYEEEENF
ncbi:kelch-like protein 5 [Teleopsis dalmanni]|uniref:kelch-like protein 5 n=1 Tax=Teleopsis dalmanni TaxID=139649 RepID=UPI0018CE0286|nr:kelch-like protein 5 [Teleopsis dalmanni]